MKCFRPTLGMLFLLTAFSGCGGSTPAPAPPPPPAAPAPRAVQAVMPKPAPAVVAENDNEDASPVSRATTAKRLGGIEIPPGERIENLFVVAAPAGFTVSQNTVSPSDQFALIDKPLESSNNFRIVASSNQSPALPSSNANPSSPKVITSPAPNQQPGRNTRQSPAGFVPVPEAGLSEDGLPKKIRCEPLGATLILIPAHAAVVGTDNGPAESTPSLRVFLDPFYMTETEVTVGQYERFRLDREKKKIRVAPLSPADAPLNTPALGLSWGQAKACCGWAGLDLPTEAEWELATRGPNGLRTPWGSSRAIWPDGRTQSTISEVGRYQADISPFGLYDLAGNAKEWCLDWYAPTAFRDALAGAAGKPLRNWNGPRKSEPANTRVVKGNGPNWSAWSREGREMTKGYPDVGFRGVLRVPPLPANQSTSK